MQLITKDTPEELSHTVANWLVDYSKEVLQRQDRFTIALSGGSTPQQLFELLAKPPYQDTIEWEKWHVFWGDERYVPFEDNRNNARMAYETLLNHVPVPEDQIYAFQTNLEPQSAAEAYEQVLHQYFDGSDTTFDLVLLGMGDDGHTLSLFPGTAVIHEEAAWVKAYYLDQQEMYRLTLTTPVVNRAACVAFLVTGGKKTASLKKVLQGAYQPDKYPSQVIKPLNGNLIWFTDKAAAGQV